MAAQRQDKFRHKHNLGFRESTRSKSNAPVTHHRYSTVTTDETDGRTRRTEQTEQTEQTDARHAAASPSPAAASVAALSPDPAPAAPAATLVRFPCTDGQTWDATEALAERLDAAFPHLDIDAEIRGAHAHIVANPAKRARSPDEMSEWLTAWLQRSDNHRRNGGKHAKPKT